MKKTLIILFLASMTCLMPAQFYIHLNTGYSLSTHPVVQENRVITNDNIEMFRIKFSYGNGVNIGLAAGYSFSGNFFGEINVITTLFSQSHSDNNWEYYFKREYLKLHLTGLNGDVLIRNNSVQLAPLLGYYVNAGKWSPFIKAGLNILYLKSRYENNYTYKYFDPDTGPYLEYTELRRESEGGIEFGIRGSAGVLYRISENMLLSVDFTAVNSMYHFQKPETISFKVDGVDGIDESEAEAGKQTVDFSNIGLNIGIRYSF
jgi:outer membrane protein W